jgi:hypothetical protein
MSHFSRLRHAQLASARSTQHGNRLERQMYAHRVETAQRAGGRGVGRIQRHRPGRESPLARGAKVVVSAAQRGSADLSVSEISGSGGKASYVAADAVDHGQVQHVASFAVQAYGRIDTWVNCAAVSLFAGFECLGAPLAIARLTKKTAPSSLQTPD